MYQESLRIRFSVETRDTNTKLEFKSYIIFLLNLKLKFICIVLFLLKRNVLILGCRSQGFKDHYEDFGLRMYVGRQEWLLQ